MPSASDAPDIAALLERYERPLVRYATSILGDLESARDVVQETFIRLVRHGIPSAERQESQSPSGIIPMNGRSARRHRMLVEHHASKEAKSGDAAAAQPEDPEERESRTAAWLFTVCRNLAIDVQRKNSRIIPMPLPEDRRSPEPPPDRSTETRDTTDVLLRLMEELTPNQREVIRLKFQNDLSYKEISEITKLSVTNVGFLLHTGLKKLRALAEEDPDFADYPPRKSISK